VDPKREGRTLHARRVTFVGGGRRQDGPPPDTAVAGTARALLDAASWVGCDAVVVEDVVPSTAGSRLRRALAADL